MRNMNCQRMQNFPQNTGNRCPSSNTGSECGCQNMARSNVSNCPASNCSNNGNTTMNCPASNCSNGCDTANFTQGNCGYGMNTAVFQNRPSACCSGADGCSPDSSRYNDPLRGMPVGIGYVPWQTWECPFDLATGLQKGTVFHSLSLPFLGCVPNNCRTKGGIS